MNKLLGIDPGPMGGDVQPQIIEPGTVGQFLRVEYLEITETFTESGAWVCPTGVTSVAVFAIGGGAGGNTTSGGTGNTGKGEGGGGGESSYDAEIAVTAGNSYDYVIGQGGIGGSVGMDPGNGEDSTWNATDLVAKGGDFGDGGVGGLGGTGGTGTTKYAGGAGGDAGLFVDHNGGGGGSSGGTAAIGVDGQDEQSGTGGIGGVAPTGGGDGGAGGTASGGTDGTFPGGGGGGSSESLSSPYYSAGAGAPGYIEITYVVTTEVVAIWGDLTAADIADLVPVSSVENIDGSLTVAPETGEVVASLNTAHANNWTAQQTHAKLTLALTTNDTFAWTLTTATP